MAIYLDYNATTPVHESVLNTMMEVYRDQYGNPDSRTHSHGEAARITVESARKQVASLLGTKSDEVFFTSGATESNNIAIQGIEDYAKRCGKKHIITTAIEHKAVLETAKAMSQRGFQLDFVNPDQFGRISAPELLSKVREDTVLVSVQHVNNETGIIQPVKEIGETLCSKNVLFHIDATQSCGKLVDEIRGLKYDMMSFSAHKFQGPQGIGCLILRKKDYKLPPVKAIMYGGQQEHGIRPGTIPVALVAGCGKACEIAERDYDHNRILDTKTKESIIAILKDSGVSYLINGDQDYCVPTTINICFPGVSSEALMLSTKQYCSISNGSACTSRSYAPSYVLTAMGLPVERIGSSVRISWGTAGDENELCEAFYMLLNVVKSLQ